MKYLNKIHVSKRRRMFLIRKKLIKNCSKPKVGEVFKLKERCSLSVLWIGPRTFNKGSKFMFGRTDSNGKFVFSSLNRFEIVHISPIKFRSLNRFEIVHISPIKFRSIMERTENGESYCKSFGEMRIK